MVALLAAGGCSAEGGTPKPETTTADARTTTASSEPSSTRPRSIRLDGRNPCELLTSDQLAQLGVDQEGRSSEFEALKSTGCTWTVTGANNILVPVLHEGIEAWTSGKRTGQPVDAEPVAGFPTITVAIPGSPNRCDLMIDTAEGQYLAVAFSVSPSFQDRFPKPCDGARQLAEAAMQNLLK
ncbi:hypothetical protein JOF41_000754 [Saccharothrix coeruleofusca]|uniref:DUF3558 domain-containing protein n=1 Tax=Saccharothrix coeruleofusca TaxID=33919 RepID=UPI001AEB531F|nr:DUF3558 domain-containing protein [Saccharothrix coeruleofusca]MBP2334576.1 hypothetical protein [Saccharothrix coeruleofusca]